MFSVESYDVLNLPSLHKVPLLFKNTFEAFKSLNTNERLLCISD